MEILKYRIEVLLKQFYLSKCSLFVSGINFIREKKRKNDLGAQEKGNTGNMLG